MDLKVNGISFQGKREILYGLTKAAQNAREYEINQTAYLASRIQLKRGEEQAYKKASINAYLDMVIHDNNFANVVKDVRGKDLIPIKKILAPFQTEHGTVEPMKIFSSALDNIVSNYYFGKAYYDLMKSHANELLSKLKLEF